MTTQRQSEIDDIFTLLTYALVYQDWQPDTVPRKDRRGYNIGALLVNPEHHPVHFDLNCINSTDNATQHGEVRAITSYITAQRCFNLSGYTIYTSLEPCVMCAGMITMVAIDRAIFGQHDVAYSKAFERLTLDLGTDVHPYPRVVQAQASSLKFCRQLDEAYQNFLKVDNEKVLAKFLASQKAKDIYKQANEAFLEYEVLNEQNQAIYKSAIKFLNP